MTDYNAMSHQQLYSYAWSGSPSAVEGEATLSQSQGKAVTDAANSLFSTLTKIQSSWSGAAAEEFTQQTNAIINQMKDHAEAAQKIYTVMSHVSSVLSWAQKYMPSPPSGAEEAIADIDNNAIVGTIIGLGTFGTSALASEAAKEDIEAKKATAVHVMTALASAYTTATNELLGTSFGDPITDPVPEGTNNKKSKEASSGGSSSAATNAAAAGMMLPYAAGVAAAHTGGASAGGVTSPGTTGYSYTAPSASTGAGATGTSSPGATGTGSGSTGLGTVTSGLGGTSATGTGGTTGAGSTGSSTGYGESGTASDVASYGGAGALGGYGSGGLISADGDAAGSGAGGSGGYGSYGSGGSTGSGTIASGGTGTGEIGDEEASGTGTGLVGSDSGAGTTAAAAASESSGSGTSAEGMGGMMGGMGMGRGGAGGGEERGNRASWLKEDEDYWYSEKMKNATPPGGLIE